MKIFVSHSIKDKRILDSLQTLIKGQDLKLLIAEHEISIDHPTTVKIEQMIKQADLGLVLLTKNGFDSGFVREEIGFLKALNKKTILAIEKDLKQDYGGFKYGWDYIEIDPKNPDKALEKIKSLIHREYQRLTNEKNQGILVIIGLVLAALFLGSND